MPDDSRDDPRIPPLSLVLGYGPMAPLLIAGVACWFVGGGWLLALVAITITWSSVLLLFLAGVRRGLSFFTPGGPRPGQIAAMFGLFILGLAALVIPYAAVSLLLALIGYASLMIIDPVASDQGRAPAFFARLRPPQMLIAVTGLALMLIRILL